MPAEKFIHVIRRAADFTAHVQGNPARWEAGRTASEAINKLVVSFPELGGAICLEIDPHVQERLQHVYDAQCDSFSGSTPVSRPAELLAEHLIELASPASRSTRGITRGKYHPARYKLTPRGLAYLDEKSSSRPC